jgi:hypothetical protein
MESLEQLVAEDILCDRARLDLYTEGTAMVIV